MQEVKPNPEKLPNCGTEATSSGGHTASHVIGSRPDNSTEESSASSRSIVEKDKQIALSAPPYLPGIPLATSAQPYPYPYPHHMPYYYDPNLLPTIRGLPISSESVINNRSDSNTRSRGTSPMTVTTVKADRMSISIHDNRITTHQEEEEEENVQEEEDCGKPDAFPACTAPVDEEEPELLQVRDIKLS